MDISFFSLPILFPLVSAIFVFVLGFFVFTKDVQDPINRTFGLICLVFTAWLSGTVMMFIANSMNNDAMIIFWDRFVYMGVVFMPALQYHFALLITRNKPNIFLYLAYALSAIFLFFVPTDYFVSGVFHYQWGAHTIAQPLHHLFLLFFFSYIGALLITLYRHYKKPSVREERIKIILAFIAFMILNLVGGMGYLPAYEISMFPFSLAAPSIFAIIMAYAIIRYKFLDIKVFAAQVFIALLLIVSFIKIFASWAGSWQALAVEVVLFVIMVIISFLLLRGVKKEIQRKDQLQDLADKLAVANDRLKEMDKTKSEFISIASHQLRTPLTAVKGFISLIMEGSYGKVEGPLRNALNKVYVSNERLIQLVEDLLSISRIEAGRLEYKFRAWRVGDILTDVADMFRLRARDGGLELRLELPEKPLPEANIDGDKIREVLSNLIDNAVKYTQEGFIRIAAASYDDKIRITIEDSGIGIPPEDLPYLFEKFSRGKDTNRLHASGSGLGLYVGKQIVQAHGGDIHAFSPGEGKGSTFVVDLPVKQSDEKEDVFSHREEEGASGDGKRGESK